MCSSSSNDELNKLFSPEEGPAAETLVVAFGAYMNWGRWNHNIYRIQELIQQLLQFGYNVQLQHDDKETSRESHGFVTVSTTDGVQLAHSDDVQHNQNYRNRAALLMKMAEDVKSSFQKA